MSLKQIDLRRQSQDYTLNWEKLELNFLNGNDLNLTDGTNNATITGLRDGVDLSDAVTYQQLLTYSRGRAWKTPVRAIATTNQSLTGAATIDDVVLSTGDRVACFSQTTTTQDGVYVVDTVGAWTRAEDWAEDLDTSSFAFMVQEGTTYDNTQWVVENDAGLGIVGTDDIDVVQISGPGSFNAQNGLTLNGVYVELGGSLLQDTEIDTNGYSLSLGLDSTGRALFVIDDDAVELSVGGVGSLSFDYVTGDMILTDDRAVTEGLQYADDYSADFTDRSLVDKAYVDANSGGTWFKESFTLTKNIINNVGYVTLSNIPVANSVILVVNGATQAEGAGKQYTIENDDELTFVDSGDWKKNDVLEVQYQYSA